ncbi:MAG TPA: hypothetical protein VGM91_18785 [Conexibacter sp.]|jgi:hypothetical protein
MQPIVVALALMRGAAPDVALTRGRVLPARVLERGPNGMGILNLSGAILTAKLPEELEPGERLRLVVRETANEQVLLQIAQRQDLYPSSQPPAPAEVKLPGGGRFAVTEREGGGEQSDEGPAAVTLRCELPQLGLVELRVSLDPSGIAVDAAFDDGLPLALGERRAPRLREAITAVTRRLARVSARRRHRPVDLYA